MPYQINVFTGEFDKTGTGSVPGGNITLNAQSGPPLVGTSFSLLPENPFGTIPVLETFNDSVVNFANNAWETAYIVDPSTVSGLKGTFQTVQAAITAAFSNGDATPDKFATIILRNTDFNDINENLTFPVARFHIKGLVPGGIGLSQPQFINGLNTIPAGCTVVFDSISLFNAGSNVISSSGTTMLLNSYADVITQNSDTAAIYSYNSSIGSFNISDGNVNLYATAITTVANSTLTDVNFILKDCAGSGGVQVLNINGSASGSIIDCDKMLIQGNTSGNVLIDSTTISQPINLPNSAVSYSQIFLDPALIVNSAFSPTTTNIRLEGSSKGNISFKKVVSGNSYTILDTDQCVEFTNAGTVTIGFSNSNLVKDQEFFLFDGTGSRKATPLVINAGSGRTINGGASITLTQDWGSCKIIFDGTNFFAFYDHGLVGDTSGTTPLVGYIGQSIRSYIAQGSATPLVAGTAKTITSITLTPGTWSLSAQIAFTGGTLGATTSFIEGSISAANNTRGLLGDASASINIGAGANSTDTILSVSDFVVNVAANTTYYMVGFVLYSAGSISGYGRLSAIRKG